MSTMNIKKQPLEVFYKKAVLKNFLKIHRKISVLKSLFNQVAGLWVYNFIKKKRFQHRCLSVNIKKIFKKHLF